MFAAADVFAINIIGTIVQSCLNIPFREKIMLFSDKNRIELSGKYSGVKLFIIDKISMIFI